MGASSTRSTRAGAGSSAGQWSTAGAWSRSARGRAFRGRWRDWPRARRLAAARGWHHATVRRLLLVAGLLAVLRERPPGRTTARRPPRPQPVRRALGLGVPEAPGRARPTAGGLAEVARACRDPAPLDPERPLPGRPGRAAERRRHDPRPEPSAKGRSRGPLRHEGSPRLRRRERRGFGTAIVRQLARTIKPRRLRPTLIVVFFDGEEAPRGRDAQFERYGLRGSKVAARAFRAAEAAVVLDFVGDKELAIPRDRFSNRLLWQRLRTASQRTGFARHFPAREQGAVLDDHVPFIRAGVPAIDLIDFDFDCWHRAATT